MAEIYPRSPSPILSNPCPHRPLSHFVPLPPASSRRNYLCHLSRHAWHSSPLREFSPGNRVCPCVWGASSRVVHAPWSQPTPTMVSSSICIESETQQGRQAGQHTAIQCLVRPTCNPWMVGVRSVWDPVDVSTVAITAQDLRPFNPVRRLHCREAMPSWLSDLLRIPLPAPNFQTCRRQSQRRPNSFSRSSFFKEIQLGRPWLHCPENAERSISRSKAFISSWFICRPARIDR